MSFWPAAFDPRDEIVRVLQLASLETADGVVRFMAGTDGRFTDKDGNTWYGSQLFSVGEIEIAINGIAPAGEVVMSYFQDPDAPDLISAIRDSGADDVAGRAIRFYVQPFTALEQMQAPTLAPILFATRTMRAVRFERTGPLQRRIAVTFESLWEQRSRRRGLQYTTADHARLTGSANPSLELMPQDTAQDEKLWG